MSVETIASGGGPSSSWADRNAPGRAARNTRPSAPACRARCRGGTGTVCRRRADRAAPAALRTPSISGVLQSSRVGAMCSGLGPGLPSASISTRERGHEHPVASGLSRRPRRPERTRLRRSREAPGPGALSTRIRRNGFGRREAVRRLTALSSRPCPISSCCSSPSRCSSIACGDPRASTPQSPSPSSWPHRSPPGGLAAPSACSRMPRPRPPAP